MWPGVVLRIRVVADYIPNLLREMPPTNDIRTELSLVERKHLPLDLVRRREVVHLIDYPTEMTAEVLVNQDGPQVM